MPGDVYLVGDDGAMEPFIEQQIGVVGQRDPLRECSGLAPVTCCLRFVMDIVAGHPDASFAIIPKRFLEFLEQICLRAEVAEVFVASLGFFGHALAHLSTVVPVKRITLDKGSLDVLAMENLLEGTLDGGRAGAGRSCDRDNRMLSGHLRSFVQTLNRPRWANSGADIPAPACPSKWSRSTCLTSSTDPMISGTR